MVRTYASFELWDLSDDGHSLASGDLRNVLRTINGLPLDHSGKLSVVMNDRAPTVTLRNILLLQILGTVPDKRKAVDMALHFWYSAFVPGEYHLDVSLLALDLIQCPGTFSTDLGPTARLDADVDADLKMRCAAMCASSMTYDVADAANELGHVR